MEIIPINFDKANVFVSMFHRHNKSTIGCKFCLGLMSGDELVGVAICGRPVARMIDNGKTLEILRVCVKDSAPKGANSMLYARCKRIGMLMGYKKIITYTLKAESGCSLRAVGARIDGDVKGGSWSRSGRRRDEQVVFKQDKIRWELPFDSKLQGVKEKKQ